MNVYVAIAEDSTDDWVVGNDSGFCHRKGNNAGGKFVDRILSIASLRSLRVRMGMECVVALERTSTSARVSTQKNPPVQQKFDVTSCVKCKADLSAKGSSAGDRSPPPFVVTVA